MPLHTDAIVHMATRNSSVLLISIFIMVWFARMPLQCYLEALTDGDNIHSTYLLVFFVEMSVKTAVNKRWLWLFDGWINWSIDWSLTDYLHHSLCCWCRLRRSAERRGAEVCCSERRTTRVMMRCHLVVCLRSSELTGDTLVVILSVTVIICWSSASCWVHQPPWDWIPQMNRGFVTLSKIGGVLCFPL